MSLCAERTARRQGAFLKYLLAIASCMLALTPVQAFALADFTPIKAQMTARVGEVTQPFYEDSKLFAGQEYFGVWQYRDENWINHIDVTNDGIDVSIFGTNAVAYTIFKGILTYDIEFVTDATPTLSSPTLSCGNYHSICKVGSGPRLPTVSYDGKKISIQMYSMYTGSTFSFKFIDTAAAVPEPATWIMMILGFGAIGYTMRRKTALRYV